ncbi:hypothetical protein OKA05_15700 [Luteolibacter arcticus]|uniref:Uncharacterized protein n=1 Tax=Luteolibacter arcticus TaxID=1581411 RepID=A0ABT3GKG4_9BACT|nr:hypothetical protein [Luteolibacter arcticus]MCW1924012.1 hypothetical protein [Luteolibacter arcticus]
MVWLAISSLSAARIGISGWVALLLFVALFLLALRVLDDPGEDWPVYVWISPFVSAFAARLAMVGEARGWESWLVAYLLVAAATWITTGPWASFHTWRRPLLAAVTPLLLGLSMAAGAFLERWLPELLLK